MSVQPSTDIPTSVPAVPRSGGPWRFWGTTLWGLAIIAAALIVGVVGTFLSLLWLDPGPELSQAQLIALLSSHGRLVFAAASAAVVAAVAVLALSIRLSRLGVRDYLGLSLPRGGDVKIGLAALALLYALFALASYLSGQPPSSSYVSNLYQNAQSSGGLLGLAAALIVVAPLSEELLVRGFLLRGWAASRLGPTGGILLTTALWTAMHTQYDLFILAYVFGLGLVFGWLRLRSGSTLLTIFLHAVQNSVAFIQVALLFKFMHA